MQPICGAKKEIASKDSEGTEKSTRSKLTLSKDLEGSSAKTARLYASDALNQTFAQWSARGKSLPRGKL